MLVLRPTFRAQNHAALFVVGGDIISPAITSSNTVSVGDDQVLAHTLTADETVTWSIVGGVDFTQFEISGSTLRWLSNGTRDFSAPADSDANNTYIVTVRATDTALNTTDQTITVTVTAGATTGQPYGLLFLLTRPS